MLKTKKSETVLGVLSYLPSAIAEEIFRLLKGRREGHDGLQEIRIRAEGRCSILYLGEKIALYSSLTKNETEALVNALCDGALYAHRDTLASGYVTMRGGVRVGITGYARYEGGRLVGVSEMRSLVFRIPGGECAIAEELSSAFSEVRRGMLIYSPPGVGKTTALRSLAESLGSGSSPLRVCVVDERCEFSEEDYTSCEVDILKGYSRRAGIEIATRTMSAEVIIIDEIGADDAEPIKEVLRCGIPIVATAHAGDFDEVKCKPALAGLISSGAFDVFAGISVCDGEYRLTVDKL